MMYERIREYYDAGVWSEERVRQAVLKGVLREEEFTQITGKPYTA